MGLFDLLDFEGRKINREREKHQEYLKKAREVERHFAGGGWWSCPRCGTTNPNHSTMCKNCRNRRPR